MSLADTVRIERPTFHIPESKLRELDEAAEKKLANRGAKYDDGKDDWGLLRRGCVLALQGVIRVLMFGAQKYAADSWQTVPQGETRYRNALERHLAAIDRGEVLDPESGLPHIDHVATNALFLSHFHHSKP